MKELLKKLIPLDYITFAYILITSVYLLIGIGRLENIHLHLLFRLMVVGVIFLFIYLHSKYDHFLFDLLRHLYPLIFLASTYGETDYFNNLWFDYQDSYFADLDQQLFGMQPSLEFSKAFNSSLFSELMFFGYFSYYCVIYLTSLWLFFKDKVLCRRFFFIMMSSFYLYYFIYIVLPVAGPIYYFPPELTTTPDGFLFAEAVKFFQKVGEVPTAAFPSSHVGISLIILTVLFKYKRKLFYFIMPFTVILCFSTVYIKAHYLIDVFGGFVSAPLFYLFSNWLYNKLNKEELVIAI